MFILSYMFWRKKKDTKDAGHLKFHMPSRGRVQQEIPSVFIPQYYQEEVEVPRAQEHEIVSVEENPPAANGLAQNIFIRFKRDRLLKLLTALLLGILLFLLFLAVFGSNGNVIQSGNPSISTTYPTYPTYTTTPTSPTYPTTPTSPTYPTTPTRPIPKQVVIGGTTVIVRLAITDNEQQTGLRFTPTLGPNEGMLYLFSNPSYAQFWAKDMQYSMDIIFIGSSNKVTQIDPNIPPCTASCPIHTPTSPAAYAIEVNGGYTSNHFIEVGDNVVFIY